MSDVYIDIKAALGDPLTMDTIALAIVDAASHRQATQVGGLELGAAPLVGAVVCRSARRYPLAGFIVRKSVSDHGMRKRIEGVFEPAARTLLIEDVTTTGGSALQALAAIREAGGDVLAVLSVVDREAGAREALAALGVELVALATLNELRR